MKILITSDWYRPAVNGVVTSVVNLKEQLEAKGHEVRVLTLAQTRHSEQEGNVWYIPSIGAGKIYPGARAAAGSGGRFVSEMVEWKPDVVHSQCEFATFRFAKQIARKTGAKFLHTYHTVYEDYTHYFSPSPSAGRKAAAAFSRMILNQTDGVIVPTEKVRRLLEGYGVKKPLYTVPSGIDCGQFAREREKTGCKALDAQILITVGRLAREKNIGEILNWLADPRGAAYRYLIVGDGPCRSELETQAKRLGIRDRVFFAGMVRPEEVPAWYQKGRVFVSASESETQGLTYLEALAAGIPAVCRKDACLEGVIQNGRNGWQYETREEFFDALETLAVPEIYRRISKGAVWTAGSFDQTVFAEKILEVYQACGEKEEMIWRLYPDQRRLCG
ncbi:MAG: glycosyltransferase family 4 protein [Eubacteriales bacterium]|nr:glycosyltransferase family 4 protein [Eubacteriales bacterium]